MCTYVHVEYSWNFHAHKFSNTEKKTIKKVSPSCYLAIVLWSHSYNGRRSSVTMTLILNKKHLYASAVVEVTTKKDISKSNGSKHPFSENHE